jgi:hypothetical protein
MKCLSWPANPIRQFQSEIKILVLINFALLRRLHADAFQALTRRADRELTCAGRSERLTVSASAEGEEMNGQVTQYGNGRCWDSEFDRRSHCLINGIGTKKMAMQVDIVVAVPVLNSMRQYKDTSRPWHNTASSRCAARCRCCTKGRRLLRLHLLPLAWSASPIARHRQKRQAGVSPHCRGLRATHCSCRLLARPQ